MIISKKTKTLLCVALVGFIMLIISLAIIILELPFFKLAKTGELAVQTAPAGGKRAATWIILIVAILLPAIFFTPLMDGGAGSPTVMILFYAGIVAAVGGVAAIIVALAKKLGKATLIGGCCLTVSGALLALVAKLPMYADYAVWTAPGVNSTPTGPSAARLSALRSSAQCTSASRQKRARASRPTA